MLGPLEFSIGLRYTRAKRRNHFISFISMTSMLGIVVGVWALITVLSIMNGFERELRNRILAVASHVTVSGPSGWLSDWPTLESRVKTHPEVVSSAPYILGQGMLTKGTAVTGTLIRGVLPEKELAVSQVLDKIVEGDLSDLQAGRYGIILGSEVAWQLGVTVGDKVTVVAPKGQITPAGLLPRLKRFTVVGIFRLGMYEYDNGLAIVHIEDAARLLKTEGQVTGLRLALSEVYNAPLVRLQLDQRLGGAFNVGDWTREHANFFRALKIEKRVMFIILLLIIAVAAFNIVSTLVMMVTDKQPDIAILRTLGISQSSVMGIFMIQGTLIGFIGTVLGGIAGIATALNIETIVPWLENLLSIEFFPASIYVISDFPAELRSADVAKICGASFVISCLATIYPAFRAARLEPAEALRYE